MSKPKPKFPDERDLDKIQRGGKEAQKVLRKFEKQAVSTSTGCLLPILTLIAICWIIFS